MTNTNRRRRQRESLFRAQDGSCPICGDALRAPETLDHVWPCARHRRSAYNRLLVHQACNWRKQDRDPTGCELIWLAAVRARMGYPVAGFDVVPNKKHTNHNQKI